MREKRFIRLGHVLRRGEAEEVKGTLYILNIRKEVEDKVVDSKYLGE